jgi:hypothetical protein
MKVVLRRGRSDGISGRLAGALLLILTLSTLPPEGMVGGGYEAHVDARSGCLLFTFISH